MATECCINNVDIGAGNSTGTVSGGSRSAGVMYIDLKNPEGLKQSELKEGGSGRWQSKKQMLALGIYILSRSCFLYCANRHHIILDVMLAFNIGNGT